MTKRENIISIYRRKGFSEIPVEFGLCPSLAEVFKDKTGENDYAKYFGFSIKSVSDLRLTDNNTEVFKKYYDIQLKPGTFLDKWGVAHEPGSKAAKHMTRMRHPLAKADSLSQLKEYPFPDFHKADWSHQKKEVDEIHKKGLAAAGSMACTIWETSWYLRSMEQLMVDMMTEDKKAEYLFDKITELACVRAEAYAKAGVDSLHLGDDVGMQSNIMMSGQLYRTWLKPRLKKVIETARAVKPEIIVLYHSCGYVVPFIPDFIEAGVDVLNPVQPESMSFERIHAEFGEVLSFNGTIGTQTTMPFGKPEDVKREVFRNLKIAGSKGGLVCCPTHLLEPEVPWENITAYVEACKEFVK